MNASAYLRRIIYDKLMTMSFIIIYSSSRTSTPQPIQKSYTKKGKAAAKAAAANGKIQNGKANGHITHDINHNVTDTKPSENKKEN